jgi:hypothetical protein
MPGKKKAEAISQYSFCRADAENDVQSVMERFSSGGEVVISNEIGVVAFQTDDIWIDAPSVRMELEKLGHEVVAIYKTTWEVIQDEWSEDEGEIFDEKVVAIAFNAPGLDPEVVESDLSNSPVTKNDLIPVDASCGSFKEFLRQTAEAEIEEVLDAMGGAGQIVVSEEEGVIAYQTGEYLDPVKVRHAVEAIGYEVVAVYPCKWKVEQWDEEEQADVTYDEEAYAIAINVVGLDPANVNQDESGANFDPAKIESLPVAVEASSLGA